MPPQTHASGIEFAPRASKPDEYLNKSKNDIMLMYRKHKYLSQLFFKVYYLIIAILINITEILDTDYSYKEIFGFCN